MENKEHNINYWTLPLIFIPVVIISCFVFMWLIPYVFPHSFWFSDFWSNGITTVFFFAFPAIAIFLFFSYLYLLAARFANSLKWIVLALTIAIHVFLLYDLSTNYSISQIIDFSLFACGYWIPFFFVANKLKKKKQERYSEKKHSKIERFWLLPVIFCLIQVVSGIIFIWLIPYCIQNVSFSFYDFMLDGLANVLALSFLGPFLFLPLSYCYLLIIKYKNNLKWVILTLIVLGHVYPVCYSLFACNNSLEQALLLFLFFCGYWVPFFIVANKLARQLQRNRNK